MPERTVMKSHESSLLHISEGILRDIGRAYPEYRGVVLDHKRLTHLCKNRGLGLFTLDLPEYDSLLLKGLESGLLPSKGYRKVSKEVKVPRLLSGLWLRIFTKDLCLRSDVDVNAIFFLRQLFCIGKKTQVPCSNQRNSAAIKEYIYVESALPRPTLQWGSDELDPVGVGSSLHLCDYMVTNLPLFPNVEDGEDRRRKQALLSRCQQVADIVSTELGNYCAFSYSNERVAAGSSPGLGHGPGAVSERTGAYDKYDFTSWPNKLEVLFPWEVTGRMPNSPKERPSNAERPSRLILVPKTAKSPRIIAAEPSENQYCQKITRLWFEERISATFLGKSINFRRQNLSQDMVKQASLTRNLATVDLSSASDRLSCKLVERLFRRNPSVLAHLHAHRTKWIKIPLEQGNDYLELKKFASQGTAVTFPVQTLCFYIMAIASLCDTPVITKELVSRLSNQVRVFGDDIIIPSRGYARLVELLHTTDLKVNEDKSFVNGYFRESCGADMYMGYDVTPVKPKTTILDGPASWQAVLDTSNNLFVKGMWHASEQLKCRYDRDPKSRVAVVGRDAVTSGFVSNSTTRLVEGTNTPSRRDDVLLGRGDGSYSNSNVGRLPVALDSRGRKLKTRWNPSYQRVEVLVQTIRSRQEVRSRDCGYNGLLQFSIRERSKGPANAESSAMEFPLRSTLRKVSRWVAYSDLAIGRG